MLFAFITSSTIYHQLLANVDRSLQSTLAASIFTLLHGERGREREERQRGERERQRERERDGEKEREREREREEESEWSVCVGGVNSEVVTKISTSTWPEP